MLQHFIHRLLLRRHFWRHATFSEIAELYMSRSLTVFALRFVMVFASVYLLQLGYSVFVIALFWAIFYFFKAICAYPAAVIITRYGPKHGLLLANVLFAFGMMMLFSVETYGSIMLALWGIIHGFAGTLNNLCYLVDFSKVKHAEHAGKELGYMNIVEKVAAGLSPVIGGLIASVFAPIWAIALSAFLFLASAAPLLRTGEPLETHQSLRFSGYPWKLTRRTFIAGAATGVDIFTSTTVWSMFITIIVFSNYGDEIYATVGALASLTLFVALAASYTFGRLIDHREGGLLLLVSTTANALTHVVRPWVNTVVGIISNNIANEISTTGHAMAFHRGVFDTADRSGFRVAYLFLMEVAANLGASLAASLLAVIFLFIFEPQDGFMIFFVVAGLLTLLIATPGFALYRKPRP